MTVPIPVKTIAFLLTRHVGIGFEMAMKPERIAAAPIVRLAFVNQQLLLLSLVLKQI